MKLARELSAESIGSRLERMPTVTGAAHCWMRAEWSHDMRQQEWYRGASLRLLIAAAAGLQQGNIITKFDGTSVSSMSDLQNLISYYRSGETVEITYSAVSDGEYVEQTVEVTLGTNTNTSTASNE